MRTARRAAEIEPFEVMDVLSRAQALERAGRHMVHMEIGEPDFTAPAPVVEAGVRALRDGRTAYTATLGLNSLREAIGAHYRSRFRVEVPASRIAITAGASGGLLCVTALYVDAGDEILVPDPGYPGYRHFVRAFEGVAKTLPVSAATDFQPTLEMVRKAWGPRTKGLLLGSPSNPTGTLISKDELARIAAFIAEREGVLMVDEIYQGLVYGRAASTVLELADDVFVIASFSKYFNMTGWRLGWIVAPEPYVREIEKLAQNLFISPSTIAQHAALACFEPATLEIVEARRRELDERRRFLIPALEGLGFRVPVVPQGAFYIYADSSALAPDSFALARSILTDAGVAVTPGKDFGRHEPERHIRIAYTQTVARLEEAVARIRSLLERKT